MVNVDIIPATIFDILKEVKDPEIPVLSVLDLGIIRNINMVKDTIIIDITPTYTGCPAIDSIASDITAAFRNANLNILVNLVLHPAWTTDDITPEGRRKLKEYGIAAPLDEVSNSKILLMGERILPCPVCYSTNTTLISQFGTTACKALFKCDDCQEPFDYFKCHK